MIEIKQSKTQAAGNCSILCLNHYSQKSPSIPLMALDSNPSAGLERDI